MILFHVKQESSRLKLLRFLKNVVAKTLLLIPARKVCSKHFEGGVKI